MNDDKLLDEILENRKQISELNSKVAVITSKIEDAISYKKIGYIKIGLFISFGTLISTILYLVIA